MVPALSTLVLGLAAFAVIFAVLERRWPSRRDHIGWRADMPTDLAYWFFTPVVTKTITRVAILLALVAVALASGVPIDKSSLEAMLSPRGAVADLPRWAQLLLLLLLADFIGYVAHRVLHMRALWPFHAVHHSSTRVDWLSAVRMHPVNDVLTRVAQALPIVLIGFDVTVLAAYVPVLAFYAIFVHANVPWSFGPLRYVLASPAFHRWHHAAEGEGVGRNFAGMFPVFDVLFGTFYMPMGSSPQVFGAPCAEVPNGLLAQLWYPMRARRAARAVSEEAAASAA
jgi:sterol desaturase/sphingolipid hydroxylase (fatty acid hydroxylase superfamily)